MFIGHLGSLVFTLHSIKLSEVRLGGLDAPGPSESWLQVFCVVKSPIRCVKKGCDGIRILRITCDSYADGKSWFLSVFCQKITNSEGY